MENLKNEDILEIIFIRHAETDYKDIGDRDNCDGELTKFGEKQCDILGEKLKDVEIDGFISSSLLRAFKTATGVCKAKADNPVLHICPELIECGCTPGYFGCSEKYLQKYYKNTKMCEKLFGTEEYEIVFKMLEKFPMKTVTLYYVLLRDLNLVVMITDLIEEYYLWFQCYFLPIPRLWHLFTVQLLSIIICDY